MGYSKRDVIEVLRRGYVYKVMVQYFHDKTYQDVGVMKGRGINEPTTRMMYRVVNEHIKNKTGDDLYVQVVDEDVYVIEPEFIQAGYTVPERMRVYINTYNSLYKGGQ